VPDEIQLLRFVSRFDVAIEPLRGVRKWRYVMRLALQNANHRNYEENSSSGTEQAPSESVVCDCANDS
jgi:hypothetical protein